MLIIEWACINEIEALPPFGNALASHICAYKGTVKKASCSAWNLLYKALEDNALPVEQYVSFSRTGKPYFVNSTIYFSISHSKEVCAVAIANKPIGVDIEMFCNSYKPKLIDRSLTDAERKEFDGDFTRVWCRKEAVSKISGKGIVGYPIDINTVDYQYVERIVHFNEKQYWLVAAMDKGLL